MIRPRTADEALVSAEAKRRDAEASRVEVDALVAMLRPRVHSTELMVRPHTTADTASV